MEQIGESKFEALRSFGRTLDPFPEVVAMEMLGLGTRHRLSQGALGKPLVISVSLPPNELRRFEKHIETLGIGGSGEQGALGASRSLQELPSLPARPNDIPGTSCR